MDVFARVTTEDKKQLIILGAACGRFKDSKDFYFEITVLGIKLQLSTNFYTNELP